MPYVKREARIREPGLPHRCLPSRHRHPVRPDSLHLPQVVALLPETEPTSPTLSLSKTATPQQVPHSLQDRERTRPE